MLKCAGLYTYEIDDPGVALDDIKAQLDEKIELLEHSAGIVMCHPEFIASGVLRHICENLPFELAGATSAAQAVCGEAGEMILTIFLMTSDDIRFRAGVTDDLSGGINAPTEAAYLKASEGEQGEPGLALVFPPLVLEYSGDDYVDSWVRIVPNTPLFGTLAIEEMPPFELSETIHNGEAYKTAMSFILCYGNISPCFLIGTLSEGKAVPFKGEITKSKGAFVQEINSVNAYQYFEDMGFAKNGDLIEIYGFVLYTLDLKKREDYDGIPVVRGLASFTEDGTAIFRGDMDEGSTFSMLTSDYDDVLSTTREKIAQINDLTDINGALMFSCIIRFMVAMRGGLLKELESVVDAIRPDIPYMMGYAGGEICPTSIKNDIPINRFHNYSLVILLI